MHTKYVLLAFCFVRVRIVTMQTYASCMCANCTLYAHFILCTDSRTCISKGLSEVLASERSERDTLRSVQLRIGDILLLYIMVRENFVLITRKEGGA